MTWNVLLVGAGNLGRALLAYRGFDAKGFRLVAVFDNDATKIGKKFGQFSVQPLSELEQTVKAKSIRLAMIAVPADFAQNVAEQLIEGGVLRSSGEVVGRERLVGCSGTTSAPPEAERAGNDNATGESTPRILHRPS